MCNIYAYTKKQCYHIIDGHYHEELKTKFQTSREKLLKNQGFTPQQGKQFNACKEFLTIQISRLLHLKIEQGAHSIG